MVAKDLIGVGILLMGCLTLLTAGAPGAILIYLAATGEVIAIIPKAARELIGLGKGHRTERVVRGVCAVIGVWWVGVVVYAGVRFVLAAIGALAAR